MQATARMASVVSSTLPARRRLVRTVRRSLDASMDRRTSFFAIAAGIGLTTKTNLLASESHENFEAPLSLRIPATESNDARKSLMIDGFHLVLTNQAKERIAVWNDWCSWEWFCPKISIQIEDRKFESKKNNDKIWTVNYPDPFYLEPGDHYLLRIDLLSDSWIRDPRFSFLPGIEAIVAANYCIHGDDRSREMNIWTGTVVTETKVFLQSRLEDAPRKKLKVK